MDSKQNDFEFAKIGKIALVDFIGNNEIEKTKLRLMFVSMKIRKELDQVVDDDDEEEDDDRLLCLFTFALIVSNN